MKIRLYMDVPEYASADWVFFASSRTISKPVDGYTRIAIDVDVPVRDYDVVVSGKATEVQS